MIILVTTVSISSPNPVVIWMRICTSLCLLFFLFYQILPYFDCLLASRSLKIGFFSGNYEWKKSFSQFLVHSCGSSIIYQLINSKNFNITPHQTTGDIWFAATVGSIVVFSLSWHLWNFKTDFCPISRKDSWWKHWPWPLFFMTWIVPIPIPLKDNGTDREKMTQLIITQSRDGSIRSCDVWF